MEEPASSPTASLQGSEAQPTYRSNATEDVAVANMLATVLGPAFADLLPPAGAAAAASPQQRPLSAGAASARSTVGPLRGPVVGLGAAAASAAEDSAEEASVGPYAQLLDGGALQRALAAERAGSESLDTLGIEAAFGHGLGGASPKVGARDYTPEITKVKVHRKMPLKIHRGKALKIHCFLRCRLLVCYILLLEGLRERRLALAQRRLPAGRRQLRHGGPRAENKQRESKITYNTYTHTHK